MAVTSSFISQSFNKNTLADFIKYKTGTSIDQKLALKCKFSTSIIGLQKSLELFDFKERKMQNENKTETETWIISQADSNIDFACFLKKPVRPVCDPLELTGAT